MMSWRSQGTHYLYTFIQSEAEKWQTFIKCEKWQKLTTGLNHMHIFKPWKKNVQSCMKISIKLYKELRLQDTHCLYTFRKWQKFTRGKKWQK